MSMNAEQKNSDPLLRLLKLKRHESPPPRYFNDFSSQVISRIRAGTPGGRFESFEDIVYQSPWMRRFWRAIEHRPAVSGLFAAGLCGLLVVGVFMSDNTPRSLNFTADVRDKADSSDPGGTGQNSFAVARTTSGGLLFDNSTNPAIQLPSGPSLFKEFPKLDDPQRVNGMPILIRPK
jgi:hypothetical protein